MKKHLHNTVISIAVIIALCGGILTGCGSGDTQAPADTVAADIQAADTNHPAAEELAAPADDPSYIKHTQDANTVRITDEDGPFGRYPEPVTVRMVKGYGSGDAWKLDILAKAGETLEDNRNTRCFRDMLNIHVVYDWIVDWSQYEQKMKMAISSGDLPDIIKFGKNDLSAMNQFAEAGLIQPVGDYWDKYASPLTKEFTDMDSPAIPAALTYNGEMMAFPETDDTSGAIRYMWLRLDWMESLGLEAPATIDELMGYMRVMVEGDPDGNGKDDTYGMLLDQYLWDQASAFCWMFNAYPTTWYEAPDRSLVYGAVQPAMKEPLAYLNRMYRDGWLDPDFTVKDYGKAAEIVAAGRCGVVFGPHWSTHVSLSRSKDSNPDADWGAFELPKDINGQITKVKLELGLMNAVCVNANYDYPEVPIKMINLYNQLMFGDDGDYAYYCSPFIDGQLAADLFTLAPITGLYPHMNADNVSASMLAYSGQVEPESLKGASRAFYNNSIAEWAWWRMFGPDRSAGLILSRIYADKAAYVKDNLYSRAPTETMADRWAQLRELSDTAIRKMITGDRNIESDFDAYVDDWNRMGGAKVVEEVNAWYLDFKQ